MEIASVFKLMDSLGGPIDSNWNEYYSRAGGKECAKQYGIRRKHVGPELVRFNSYSSFRVRGF